MKNRNFNKIEKRIIPFLLGSVAILSACNGGGGSGSNTNYTYPPNPANYVPQQYMCLPSNLPMQGTRGANLPKIAYGSNCQVGNESTNLVNLAVRIIYPRGGQFYSCTGTPIAGIPGDQHDYIVTAAHCVTTNKAANLPVTSANIISAASISIYQGATSNPIINAGVTAVYVPSQYCQTAMLTNGSCSNFPVENGDIAILQVSYSNLLDTRLGLNSELDIADQNIQPVSPSYITALGYGMTNIYPYNSDNNLYYITYEYFATNAYQGVSSLTSLMNGYSPAGSNSYYSIICRGDSGGGDFYWDTTTSRLKLIGTHSYGSGTCGAASSYYSNAMDISTDVRPFASQINQIRSSTATGCNSGINGFACQGS